MICALMGKCPRTVMTKQTAKQRTPANVRPAEAGFLRTRNRCNSPSAIVATPSAGSGTVSVRIWSCFNSV